MAWDDLLANQMISFFDIQESKFTLKEGQVKVDSNQCITKLQALTMYNINPLALEIYANNQLIPKPTVQCTPSVEILGSTLVVSYAKGMVIDSNFNVYVTNPTAGRIIKITPQGVSSVLTTSTMVPRQLAITPNDTLYFCGNSNYVTKLSTSGTKVEYGPFTVKPLAIVADSNNNIYFGGVLPVGNVVITKLEPNGTSTTVGTYTGNFTDLAVDSLGNIFTIFVGENIVKKISSGNVTTFATTGNSPRGIITDSNNNVYTVNLDSNTVTKITPLGQATTLGSTGTNTDSADIAIDSLGNIYTSNYSTSNVTRITQAGISTTLNPTNIGTGPAGIAIDSSNNIYTLNLTSIDVTKITDCP